MTCIFLCAIYSIRAQTGDSAVLGQTVDRQAGAILQQTADRQGGAMLRQAADSLYRGGFYFEASIAYERWLFENNDQVQQLAAIEGKTACLKKQGLFDQAAAFLEGWQSFPFPDSGLTEIHYQQVLCNYLGGHFENALSLEERWPYLHAGQQAPVLLQVLRVLSLNELQRWGEAAVAYRELVTRQNREGVSADPYAHLPRLKDVKKAQWLSTFIPGAGQMYAGRPGEGLVSLVVQAAGIYFAVLSFEQHYYISGLFIGAALFASFHTGGVSRAEILVREYNRKVILAFNQQVKRQLLSSL